MIKYLLSKHEAPTYSNTTNMYTCVCLRARAHIKETANDFAILFLSTYLKEKNAEVQTYVHATLIEALFIFHNNKKQEKFRCLAMNISHTNEILFSL